MLHEIGKTRRTERKALEESNRAKNRFLARMSHEIRTPITAIMGTSEMQLRGKSMPPHTEEAFIKVYDASKTLLNIVNDILDFSKIESGKMPLLIKEYDTTQLANDVSHLHLIYLDNKNLNFTLHVDKQLPIKLKGDLLRIRQIINNLMTNAFKYTESGSIDLSIRRQEHDNKGFITLLIAIEDTGMGMSKEQIEKIQEENNEYMRWHEQERPYVSGTGLGLSIVYSMMQMMNADIVIDSELGVGTIVTISIPQEIVDTAVIGETVAKKLQNFEINNHFNKDDFNFETEQMPYGTVLVVDDVDTNLYVAQAMLEAFGLKVELVVSGELAIEKIKQGNVYDIIFLDHMMPGMDGMEVAKKLRSMQYHQPIVALTANAIKGQAEIFMDNGFSGFMSKPIDIKILYSYLIRFVKNKE